MAYWEFLLQKEGDRDWLPLETAHVEISEGRYRIIAHTSYCETAVDIRLSQILAEPLPPRRKTLKRMGHTNKNGLMVVMPFTHLTPGSWIVKCGAIAAPETSAPMSWEYGVELQVLAIESGVEYWDTDLDEAAIAEQLSSEPVPAESKALADEGVPGAEQPSPPSATAQEAPTPPQAVSSPPVLDDAFIGTPPLEDLPLRLQLQHQALVAHAHDAIALQGQVVSFSQVEGLPGEATLWVLMRNPETGEVVHQTAQALSVAVLPQRFDVPITLPPAVSTRLLIGELSLWTATEPPQILAIQGFTVTLNLDTLLEMVANQAERSSTATFEDLPVPTEVGEPTVEETADGDDALNTQAPFIPKITTLSPREIPFRLVYLPSTGLTLPPVIYRPIDKKAVGAPSLPTLGNQTSRRDRPSPTASQPPSAPAKPITLPPIGNPPASSSSSEQAVPESPTVSGPSVDLPSFGRPPSPQAPIQQSAQPANADAATADRQNALTFQPDFQGRFWERLSALAEEAQRTAADYKAQLEAAGVDASGEASTSPQVELPFPSFQDETGNQNYEVVVYEADEPVPSSSDTVEPVAEEPLVEVLQPEEPDIEDFGAIPIPELILPRGELIAGTPLPISVRLPMYPRRLAVKVWVTDIQSRTLIDRPRWLMNWTPGEGEQTTFLQLQVPLGSIEARFEAIAIDLATQRESYKTTHIRSILPPNLSDEAID